MSASTFRDTKRDDAIWRQVWNEHAESSLITCGKRGSEDLAAKTTENGRINGIRWRTKVRSMVLPKRFERAPRSGFDGRAKDFAKNVQRFNPRRTG
jgi:hypothetical protein